MRTQEVECYYLRECITLRLRDGGIGCVRGIAEMDEEEVRKRYGHLRVVGVEDRAEHVRIVGVESGGIVLKGRDCAARIERDHELYLLPTCRWPLEEVHSKLCVFPRVSCMSVESVRDSPSMNSQRRRKLCLQTVPMMLPHRGSVPPTAMRRLEGTAENVPWPQ